MLAVPRRSVAIGLGVVTASFARIASGAATAPPLRPTPRWVEEAPLDPAARPGAAADNGVEQLLSDQQVHVGASVEEHYTRRVIRIDSPAGIEASSELTFDFDPTFEHLALHRVHILRGGRTLDALPRADWKVIQPESDLDKRIYSGGLEGLLFIHDVRVGDILDYEFSISGKRAVAPGRFAERFFLAENSAVAWVRRRIVADEPRQLLLKLHDATPALESSLPGRHVYAWERRDVPATEAEDDLPSWYVPEPWVEVSDFANWNDVAKSVAPLYPHDQPPSAEMNELVSRWKSQFVSEDDRAGAATTFVQDEIRYLGIELGPHSHQPFAPAVVLARRFGDCKDKSFLLVSLLRQLGIPADPVLVNTDERRQLDDRLPSPFAFDHAIVRAVVGGVTRWIDATDSFQRGKLSDREPPPFERALVVSPEAQGLQSIEPGRGSAPTYEVDDTFTVTSTADAPVALQVLTTYRGTDADDMRANLASTPVAQLGRSYLNYYAGDYPKILQMAEPSFSDDPAANVIVARESYSIPDFFTDGARDLSPEAIERHLQRPRIVLRKMPLRVDYPLVVAQHTHLRLPSAAAFASTNSDLSDGAVRFQASQRADGSTVTLNYRYETIADFVSADAAAAHLATIEKVRDAATFHLDATVARGSAERAPSDSRSWRISLGLVGLVGIFGAVKLELGRRRRRRGKAFRERAAVSAGEGPTHPIAVRAEGEIAIRLADARCSCRGALVAEGGISAEEVRMGDKIIRVVRTTCRSCGQARRIYFHVHPAPRVGTTAASEGP